MINILDKHNCCGCNACLQACPKQCITMLADNEGFLYPQVDSTICIDCGLCEQVCPVINCNEPHNPIATYATKNLNEEVRVKSSSGGVFTLLAEKIISEGGVVFGARFNENWEVIHDYTETVEGLEPLRGSKYVQSIIGDNYKIAKRFLSEDRKVLFSGTPCQIAGLKQYLRKENNNLLTIEVVCHGVPSPMIWSDYLDYKRKQHSVPSNDDSLSMNIVPEVVGISFRDKTYGWKKYGFKISYAASKDAGSVVSKSINEELISYNENLFMKGFLKNIYLRPSCYSCPARKGSSGADISIADYFGIQTVYPQFDDDKGVGLTIINTAKGEEYYHAIKTGVESIASDYTLAVKSNPCIVESVKEPKLRNKFWKLYKKENINAIQIILDKMSPSIASRSLFFIKRIVKMIIRK